MNKRVGNDGIYFRYYLGILGKYYVLFDYSVVSIGSGQGLVVAWWLVWWAVVARHGLGRCEKV